MRKLLIALLAVPLLGHAEAVFETSNQAGGKIVLTDEYCRDDSHKLAYSMVPGYDTILGCWTADNQYIHIAWYDGGLRSYDYSLWRKIKKVKPSL
jgi:hypothetical protein